ncbi:MAG TPA: hypothetical protein HA257_02835 [Candidatus Methanoperedenaceae archaeon]|nr:hypothetical protein [Candidatus Methanoperedenaceae archaeon]
MKPFWNVLIIFMVGVILGTLLVEKLYNAPGTAPGTTQPYIPPPPPKARIESIDIGNNYRAGDTADARLTFRNIGNVSITQERVVVRATATSLDDFAANLYLKTLSEERRSRTSNFDFDITVEPGSTGMLTASIKTVSQMEGRSLAGKYSVSVTLYANGKREDSQTVSLRLAK